MSINTMTLTRLQRNQLQRSRYVILRGYLLQEVSAIPLPKLRIKAFATKTASVIFQNRLENDRKRLMTIGVTGCQLEACATKVDATVKTISPSSFLSATTVIASIKGCMQQDLHNDFNPSVAYKDATQNSYLVIVAIEPNTKLVVRIRGKTNTLCMEVGDMLIGRGDLVHAGASYAEDHMRLHWYADAPSNGREENKTYAYNEVTKTIITHEYIVGKMKNLKRAIEVPAEKKAMTCKRMAHMRSRRWNK